MRDGVKVSFGADLGTDGPVHGLANFVGNSAIGKSESIKASKYYRREAKAARQVGGAFASGPRPEVSA